MEDEKKLNLLNEASDSWFVKRQWQIKPNYDVGNEIIFNTEVL